MASVRKRSWKTGTGETRTAWRIDYVDASGQRGQRQVSTKREADALRIEIEGRLRTGTFRPDSTKITVTEICTAYLTYAKGRKERSEQFTTRHFEAVCSLINNHILHAEHGLGAAKSNGLTARSISDFRDRIRSNGLSIPTTRKVLNPLLSSWTLRSVVI